MRERRHERHGAFDTLSSKRTNSNGCAEHNAKAGFFGKTKRVTKTSPASFDTAFVSAQAQRCCIVAAAAPFVPYLSNQLCK